MQASSRIPAGTYRIQLRQGFDFDQVAAVLDYLADLGVSHLYLSPCMQAAPGSTHGYDVTDPNQIEENLGGDQGFQRLLGALSTHGLEHMLDIVPNHMSVASEQNRWWWDVLENGPSSAHASTFDVDWQGPTEASKDRVLLPILGDRLGRVLEAGRLSVTRQGARFLLSIEGRQLPLAPASLAPLLLRAAQASECIELELLAEAMSLDPANLDPDQRHRRQRVLREQLAQILSVRPQVSEAVDRQVHTLNSDVAALEELTSRQHYRLANYRVARYDLDYRRFFDVSELAALKLDEPLVFEKTHARVLSWIRSGALPALRVDHPDGLRDPSEYFRRLRSEGPSLWILAEKILEPGELLPDEWPIDGTTGYDFLNMVGGLFVEPSAETALTELYRNFSLEQNGADFESKVREAKRFVLDRLLASDLRRLTVLFEKITGQQRRLRDFAFEELRRTLREVIACFEVYRTYARPGAPQRREDVQAIRSAIQKAGARPELDAELLTFLEQLLSGNCVSDEEWEFVGRLQQLSSATMAKGLEDTAFYRYFRLISLNEVGGSPGRFSVSTEEFHAFCKLMQERWPFTLVTTTTHDTKRSEDARLRIAALSEMPEPWSRAVHEWSERARRFNSHGSLDKPTEYLFWQTLVAAHPLSEERLLAYMSKAIREAKLHTSWLDQNGTYESAVQAFTRAVLGDTELMASVRAFVDKLLPIAHRSSLSQTLIKLTAYGVPDIYQGGELWDSRLTDPDNRTPIDFERCRQSLTRASHASAEEALAGIGEGLPKIWLIQRVLGLRRLKAEWFGASASYVPLHADGRQASRVLCFARADRIVVIAPRLWSPILDQGFQDTRLELPNGSFRNLFDSDARYRGTVELTEVLKRFPVALLIAEGA